MLTLYAGTRGVLESPFHARHAVSITPWHGLSSPSASGFLCLAAPSRQSFASAPLLPPPLPCGGGSGGSAGGLVGIRSIANRPWAEADGAPCRAMNMKTFRLNSQVRFFILSCVTLTALQLTYSGPGLVQGITRPLTPVDRGMLCDNSTSDSGDTHSTATPAVETRRQQKSAEYAACPSPMDPAVLPLNLYNTTCDTRARGHRRGCIDISRDPLQQTARANPAARALRAQANS